MRVAPLITCLWPGLSQLWMRGDRSAMLLALGFSALLNLALVASFIWPQLLGLLPTTILWLVLGFCWVVAAWCSYRNLATLSAPKQSSPTDNHLFQQAQTEYLKGQWFEAETLLNQILDLDPGDVDARLMLATLYRHTRQIQQARQQLGLLKGFEGSSKWEQEIQHEQQFLTRLENETKNKNVEESNSVGKDSTGPQANSSTAA